MEQSIKTKLWSITKSIGPKLVPFFKSVAIFFVLYPTNSATSLFYLIIKCLPIATLCLFIILHGMNTGFEYSYSRRILFGLIFSMIGDAFLVYKTHAKEYFMLGMASFALAHILYFTAFGLKPFKFHIGILLFILTFPINLIYFNAINDTILKVLVPIYIILISSMLWRALSRLRIFINFEWTKLCCLLGAILFVISDFVLAYDKFIDNVPYSHAIIMGSYYLAQFGISLSVIDSNLNHEVNYRVIQHNDVVDVIFKFHSKLIDYKK